MSASARFSKQPRGVDSPTRDKFRASSTRVVEHPTVDVKYSSTLSAPASPCDSTVVVPCVSMFSSGATPNTDPEFAGWACKSIRPGSRMPSGKLKCARPSSSELLALISAIRPPRTTTVPGESSPLLGQTTRPAEIVSGTAGGSGDTLFSVGIGMVEIDSRLLLYCGCLACFAQGASRTWICLGM